ncbi:unannotated protein [freshwater metagenome]|uniref:Unannotated protein n=1 Tax=freshwater metagenome TaxID=449393 RepID=A0A6J5ZK37_9ZZZZ
MPNRLRSTIAIVAVSVIAVFLLSRSSGGDKATPLAEPGMSSMPASVSPTGPTSSTSPSAMPSASKTSSKPTSSSTKKPKNPSASPKARPDDKEPCRVRARVHSQDGKNTLIVDARHVLNDTTIWGKVILPDGVQTFKADVSKELAKFEKAMSKENHDLLDVKVYSTSEMTDSSLLCQYPIPE